MDFRRSLDFDSILDYNNLSTSSEEIMWSDDETIVAEQEQIWNEGKCRYLQNLERRKYYCKYHRN